VRRAAYVPLYNEACSDFVIATKMVEQGLRTVFEPGAVCTEETNRGTDKELLMRVRIITQTFTDLWHHRKMMNPFRSGFYAIQLLSHKLLRYLVPFFLLGSLAASAVLMKFSPLYAVVPVAQALLCAGAAAGGILERAGVRSPLLALPQYFVLANLASVIALRKYLNGERYARWEPIREPGGFAPATVAEPAVLLKHRWRGATQSERGRNAAGPAAPGPLTGMMETRAAISGHVSCRPVPRKTDERP